MSLCPACRRWTGRAAASCPACGRVLASAAHGYELVLQDASRVPILRAMTIGRGPRSTVRLTDPTVSRRHARLTPAGPEVTIEDAGSSHGTWVDGRRVAGTVALRDGALIRLGDQKFVVERRRGEQEAARTIVVSDPGPAEGRPALLPGSAIKRLPASEGSRRWVLRDLRSDRFLRLDDADGRLLALLDGQRTVPELIEEARQRMGLEGPARLTRLLAALADRGLLAGSEPPVRRARRGPFAARSWTWGGAAQTFDALYARGAWRLFTRPGLSALAVVAVAGLLAFVFLVAARYGTPFVVASHVGIGGVVFVVGRLALASVHEAAHGLAMASLGRRVGRAGLKVVLVFPYAFVDTSEAWLEPRRRRMAVSAAGPVSDVVLGAVFALACLALPGGVLRDICFQLCFGAYLAALVNLNPLVERDGYHMLADVLGEPRLRARARAELAARLRGESPGSPVLVRYALAGLVWSVVTAGVAVVLSLRYAPALRATLPGPVVDVLLVSAWAAAVAPAVALVAGPLWARRRRGR
jgi:putative peptide zinc metalloprotease protein